MCAGLQNEKDERGGRHCPIAHEMPRQRAASASPAPAKRAARREIAFVSSAVVKPRAVSFKDKAAWLVPEIRERIASVRPWSVPASFIPAALSVFISWPRATSLIDCLLPVFAVVFVHFAANALNTLGDYKSGADTVEHADDRALVDRRVSIRSLAIVAALLFLTGASIALYYALFVITGRNGLWIAAAALVLGLLYTTPDKRFSLKHFGLGDTIVGLCFGPLLMLGVSMAATGNGDDIDLAVLLFSFPVMLLTVNVLHANNTRDIEADERAGAVTVASIVAKRLGLPRGNLFLYSLNITLAFVLGAVALVYAITRSYLNAGLPYYNGSGFSEAAGTVRVLRACVANADWRAFVSSGGSFPAFGVCDSPAAMSAMAAAVSASGNAVAKGDTQRYLAAGQQAVRAVLFLVSTCLPWAVALCRRFSAGLKGLAPGLKEMPQASAQFQLLFGAAALAGLLPSQAFARCLLACLFYLGGFNNVLMFGHSARLIRYKLASGLGLTVPLSVAGVLLAVATGMQLCASVTLAAGYEVKASALVLVLFLWPVTGVIHDFWNVDLDTKETTASAAAAGRKKKDDDAKEEKEQEEEQAVEAVPTFLTAFDAEFVAYFKNALALGGLAVLLAYM